MSEKKGKITLAGLGKGGGSSNFLSFRFSPESEEIEEILQEDSRALSAQGNSESAPASPKPSPGDVSPLKEYFIKEKHKWAHKWDKKSMSLDLDLKGKIFTAIEDKKKSILSNFIPEEAGIIPQSQSIPDLQTRVFSAVSEESYQSSSNISSCHGANQIKKSDQIQNFEDCEQNYTKSVSPDGSSTEVEEIGIDMTNYVSNRSSSQDLEDGSLSDKMLDFFIPPEGLQEQFGGLPTLYQPTSIIYGIRSTPLEHVSEELEEATSSTSLRSDSSQEPRERFKVPEKEDLTFSNLIFDMIKDIVLNPMFKYVIALIAITMILPLWRPLSSFCWFIIGAWTMATGIKGLTTVDDRGSGNNNQNIGGPDLDASSNMSTRTEPLLKELRLPTKSQGWMTEMDGDYDVLTCHLRQTKVVFVRLDEANLYLSYPHHKHRIPKRRLWNDPIISMEHLFVRHKVYSISNAEISIVPDGLAKKRIWNKKYPIGVKFPKFSVNNKVTPLPSVDTLFTNAAEPSVAGTSSGNTTVNYNVNTAGVSVNKQYDIPPLSKIVQKEVVKEDCSLKSIFLFARCDREKDDWYRRLVAATKLGAAINYENKSPLNPQIEYREYMKRICPTLIPFFHDTSNLGWNSIPVAVEVSSNQSDQNSKDTPSSSRKSTPDTEKPSNSKNDSVQSDLENIVTIPQSPAFLNALLGRLFYDFLKSSYWKSEITKLIDKKLHYMKKPAFIESIYVKDLEMGNAVPTIIRASAPLIDHQGLWIDLEISYEGTFCVALETHVNLLKLRKTDPEDSSNTSSGNSKNSQQNAPDGGNGINNGSPTTSRVSRNNTSSPQKTNPAQPKRSHVFDSDADDSGESSEDEVDIELETAAAPIVPDVDPNTPQTKGQKFMKMAEKFATSALMNTGYVKKMVDNLGNTPLVLSVELKSCTGTLAVNIPPPPNDRIWLGFRTNPDMQITTSPKFGDRTLNLTHLTDWIKKKLLLEFQRVAVCPNMNDLSLSLMEFDIPR